MRQKQFAWHLAPGFSVVNAMTAFKDFGVYAVENYEEISVRAKKGWKRVKITISIERAEQK